MKQQQRKTQEGDACIRFPPLIGAVWRTIKYEEVYIRDYASPREAREGLRDYLRFYNEQRLHQSLEYRTPAEVERQLLQDFERYAPQHSDHLVIDWSDSCGEGHATAYLDGWLENWSSVRVVNAQGQRIAEGWIDFIHGGGDHPLFVFWSYLHLGENSEYVVRSQGIPQHIWERLPESSKDQCVKTETYDAAWGNDPLVLQWKNQRS